VEEAKAEAKPEATGPVASPLFIAALLAVLAVYTVWGALHAGRMRALRHPDRMALYTVTLLFEWLLFGFVALGLRLRGIPLAVLIGDRWCSARALLHDIGIAGAFWVVSLLLLGVLSFLMGVTATGKEMSFLLPRGSLEIALWLVLSTSAGICEETVFRGFLQRQFTAWTKSAVAGIAVSAIAFGAAHAYQGWRRALLIVFYGAMFGVLAHWRRSLRPGMMAHAWQDSVSGILGGLLQRHPI
jgi:hypothetical protein